MRPTEVLFLIDKSGSMSEHKEELYRAYRKFLEDQKEIDLDCYVTCELFSAHHGVMHMNAGGVATDVDVKTVCAKEALESTPHLSDVNFLPVGGTPILDAIGITIDRAKFMISDDVNRQVIFVLITDGCENASKEYLPSQISELITYLRRGGWKFIYIKMGKMLSLPGGYMNSEEEKASPKEMGFDTSECFEIEGSQDFGALMGQVTEAIADYRTTGQMELTWEK